MYKKIPEDIRPSQNAAKVNYARDFDLKFAMILREREDQILC